MRDSRRRRRGLLSTRRMPLSSATAPIGSLGRSQSELRELRQLRAQRSLPNRRARWPCSSAPPCRGCQPAWVWQARAEQHLHCDPVIEPQGRRWPDLRRSSRRTCSHVPVCASGQARAKLPWLPSSLAGASSGLVQSQHTARARSARSRVSPVRCAGRSSFCHVRRSQTAAACRQPRFLPPCDDERREFAPAARAWPAPPAPPAALDARHRPVQLHTRREACRLCRPGHSRPI